MVWLHSPSSELQLLWLGYVGQSRLLHLTETAHIGGPRPGLFRKIGGRRRRLIAVAVVVLAAAGPGHTLVGSDQGGRWDDRWIDLSPWRRPSSLWRSSASPASATVSGSGRGSARTWASPASPSAPTATPSPSSSRTKVRPSRVCALRLLFMRSSWDLRSETGRRKSDWGAIPMWIYPSFAYWECQIYCSDRDLRCLQPGALIQGDLIRI